MTEEQPKLYPYEEVCGLCRGSFTTHNYDHLLVWREQHRCYNLPPEKAGAWATAEKFYGQPTIGFTADFVDHKRLA